MFDAEEAEQNAEISKNLNEEYKRAVRQAHRDFLNQVGFIFLIFLQTKVHAF